MGETSPVGETVPVAETGRASESFPAAMWEMPVVEWAAAITDRHSSRTFEPRPIDSTLFDRLQDFCAGLPPTTAARVALVPTAPAEVFTGFAGGYGRVVGAPTALVVIGTESEPTVQECAGYLGEAVVLEATSLGLGTCWIAGFFDRAVASTLVPVAPGERVLAISPLGYAQSRPRAGERLLKRLAGSHKRKPITEVAPGFDTEGWPDWAKNGVQLARNAPSAGNRQPWRFELDLGPPSSQSHAGPGERSGTLTVLSVKGGYEGNISRRLDCGIAMLHFEVGARMVGVSGRWETLKAPAVARYIAGTWR